MIFFPFHSSPISFNPQHNDPSKLKMYYWLAKMVLSIFVVSQLCQFSCAASTTSYNNANLGTKVESFSPAQLKASDRNSDPTFNSPLSMMCSLAFLGSSRVKQLYLGLWWTRSRGLRWEVDGLCHGWGQSLQQGTPTQDDKAKFWALEFPTRPTQEYLEEWPKVDVHGGWWHTSSILLASLVLLLYGLSSSFFCFSSEGIWFWTVSKSENFECAPSQNKNTLLKPMKWCDFNPEMVLS